MTKINIICPSSSFGSLYYLATIMKQLLNAKVTISNNKSNQSYKPDHLNLLIDECISSIIYKRKADIWWTDTPAMIPTSRMNITKILSENHLFYKHYTVSEFCKQFYKSLNIPVEETIIPRLVNPILFNYKTNYEEAKYDIISIGKKCECDRKNLLMQRDIALNSNLKFVFVTDAFIPKRPNIIQFNFGSISDKKKAELLSQSKFLLWTSFIEGFGMPVLEAMSTGCIPIYTDIPAHNEFAVGIPIKPKDKITSACYGVKIIKYIIDKKDVIESINYAINLSKEEYKDLQSKCIEKAKSIFDDFKSKLNLLTSIL